MTTEGFISLFCKETGEDPVNIFERGRQAGWLEVQDEVFRQDPITRKNVARILHMYLLKVKNIQDLDIKDAEVLRDLYDCRVCANHIAQMYLHGVMDAKDLMEGGRFLWFDLDGEDSDEVNKDHIRRLLSIR
ncbi:MAG: hypothetical protein J6X33_04830 [Clostridiales bacterium]|nr:hypothetical protein [Clostridiales bacterium]